MHFNSRASDISGQDGLASLPTECMSFPLCLTPSYLESTSISLLFSCLDLGVVHSRPPLIVTQHRLGDLLPLGLWLKDLNKLRCNFSHC